MPTQYYEKKKKKMGICCKQTLCLLFAFNFQKKKEKESINCSHMTRRTKFVRDLTVLHDWHGYKPINISQREQDTKVQ